MPSSSMIVPPCPSGVVFFREDFLSNDFAVDDFLAKYAGHVGLEALRDDLGMYLQVLRVAMIELINDDYADFVNLSSNLVGIDEKIGSIQRPVMEFKEQLWAFQTKLNATKAQLDGKLAERRALHDQRVALRNLEHIINALSKVERLLGLHEGSEQELALTGDLVERVASDVNYLNHCVSKCEAVAFVEEIRPRIDIIGDRLHNAMEFQFLNAVQNNDAEVLKRCLRIYASVDRVSAAEQLLRSRIIAPYLDEVICGATYHKQGLQGVCHLIYNIIPNKLQLLLQLTQNTKKQQKKLSEFKFVLNSLWPEVVEKFEQELPMIFSAGNPDQFHQHYLVMMDFIGNLEAYIPEFGGGGRQQPPPASPQPPKVLQNFVHRWNLPVYFQIRFQEIAGPVEEACQELFALEIGGGKFHLKASRVIMEAVSSCWQPEVVLKPLTPKFWKLTLQIIARYAKAVAIASETPAPSSVRPSQKLVPASNVKSHMRSSSDTQIDTQKFDIDKEEENEEERLILVYLDVAQVANQELSGILTQLVWPSLTSLTDASKDYFSESLDESRQDLKQRQDILTDVITERISEKSCAYLKQVADIPRLYRRTNRDLPTKPCTYMTSLLEPILTFSEVNKSRCPSDTLHQWLVAIFAKVSVKFFSNVSEVLDAVQKMEESLRRLKRVRGSNESKPNVAADKDKGPAVVSDDDKIRLQLLVDVKHYIQAMDSLGIMSEEVSVIVDLEKLVVKATQSCYDDYLQKLSS